MMSIGRFESRSRRARRKNAELRRRAFTLIELMVVTLIMLTVTAISIPLVLPALSGRQVREGARMVSSFISAARSRAIESGRPAGVWIERLPGIKEASANLYYAEIPQVYSGDFLDSQVELFCVNGDPTTSSMTGTIFNWESPAANCRDYWNIVVPRGRTTFNADIWASPDPSDQQVIREGDMIQIEGSDRKVPLKSVKINISGASNPSKNGTWWYIYRGRNCKYGEGPDGAYTNVRRDGGDFALTWFDRNIPVSSGTVRTTTTTPLNSSVPGLKYKIFRQPVRMQAGSIKLPEGVVIDLGFSAMTNGNNSDPGIPFHPRSDPGGLANAYWGAPAFPNDDTPVIMVFSPGGHMERIYFRSSEALSNTATVSGRWVWGGVEPFGQIHLLIGKIENIYPDEFYRSTQDAQTNFSIQVKKNWLDLENFWVNINPQTGFVSTSVVDEPQTVDSNNKQTSAYFNSADSKVGASNPQNVYLSRTKARYARTAGGY